MRLLQDLLFLLFGMIWDFIPAAFYFIIIMLLVALGIYLHSEFIDYNQIK